MSSITSRVFALVGTLAVTLTAGAATAAEPLAATEAGRDAGLVLAAGFIAMALVLRRRVAAGMWASRERAFTRRTVRAERRSQQASQRRAR